MHAFFAWTSGHWIVLLVIAAAIGIAVLALRTVVWILSHSD